MEHVVLLIVIADMDVSPQTDHAFVGSDHFI